MNDPSRSSRTSGLVFLVVGLVFLASDVASHNAWLQTLSPAFIALGVVLLANARKTST